MKTLKTPKTNSFPNRRNETHANDLIRQNCYHTNYLNKE